MKLSCKFKMLRIFLLLFLFVIAGCSKSSIYISENDSLEKYPLTDAVEIAPGLKVRYYEGKYQEIDDMPAGGEVVKLGTPGKPVSQLNNIYSTRSNVFKSGKSRLVGFWFSGLVNLEEPGRYYFQALANDGIRVYLNRRMLFEDPEKHSARLTPVGMFDVETAGWYPLQIFYFQRKGTAALKLYWQKPGGNSFEIIPEAALGHTI